MKRTFDIILAILSIIIFAIPMLLIYLSICLSGGGCVIYRQERIGYKGKPFMLYKFRSMKTNAEMDGQPMLFTNDDPRLTRIGRFLRAHHLDEFPQLWNILRGEMSFVGPRPERKYYIDQILQRRPDYVRLYALRPGIFSRATLSMALYTRSCTGFSSSARFCSRSPPVPKRCRWSVRNSVSLL